MKLRIFTSQAFLVCILFFSFINIVSAQDIQIYNADHKNQIIIYDNNDKIGNSSLFFGESLSHSLLWNDVSSSFMFNNSVNFSGNQIKNVRLENKSETSDCNVSVKGKIYFNTSDKKTYICSGEEFNVLENVENYVHLIPEIKNEEKFTVSTDETKTLVVVGKNFLPTTDVSIPDFSGTINSVTIVSATEIDIEITASSETGDYDIILSNNGAENTEWINNGVNIISVQ